MFVKHRYTYDRAVGDIAEGGHLSSHHLGDKSHEGFLNTPSDLQLPKKVSAPWSRHVPPHAQGLRLEPGETLPYIKHS